MKTAATGNSAPREPELATTVGVSRATCILREELVSPAQSIICHRYLLASGTKSMQSIDAENGMRLAKMGRFADALPYLDRANRLAPADVPLLHAVSSLLHWAGRGADAVERYQRAAVEVPQDSSVLIGWARSLLLIGNLDHALPLLDRALNLDHGCANPGGLFDMFLSESGDADVLCRILKPLTERHPTSADLQCRYAEALLAAEYLDAARNAFEQYRCLRPEDPMPCVELGRLSVSQGHPEQAQAWFRAALSIDPNYAAALWEIAQSKGWQLDTQTVGHIQQLTRTEQDPRSLAGLHDVLARHHEAIGAYSSAQNHAMRTNAMMAQLVPPVQRYCMAQHEHDIDVTIDSYTRQLFIRLQGAGSRDRRPVFIIGLPRSGTTLLEQMLASHPRINCVGEQTFAEVSLQRARIASGHAHSMLTLTAVRNAAEWHLQMLEDRLRRLAIDPVGERIVDKLPDNYLFAGWLHVAFPEAAIIHCLRDPRDVALSCWLTQFQQVHWSYDLEHITHRVEQHRRVLRHWRTILGARLVEVRYERLVTDPESELRRTIEVIGLDWHPNMLDFPKSKRYVSSASRQQVRESLHGRRVARWQNFRNALGTVLPRLDAIAARDILEQESCATH